MNADTDVGNLTEINLTFSSSPNSLNPTEAYFNIVASGVPKGTIDWGDGIITQVDKSGGFSHNWTTGKSSYKVSILLEGDIRACICGSNPWLSSIDKYKSNTITSMSTAFDYCGYLTLGSTLVLEVPKATSFSYCFRSAGIDRSTPSITVSANLFSLCVNAEDFNETFADSAVTSVNANAFAACVKAKYFTGTFSNTRIKTIGLIFKSCPDVEVIDYMFNYSDVATVSSGLLNGLTKLRTMHGAFSFCAQAAFNMSVFNSADFSAVTDCGYMFYGCAGMLGSSVTFRSKIPVTARHESCFYQCSSLSDAASIPADWK